MVGTWNELLEGRSGLASPCIPHPMPVLVHNRHRTPKRTIGTEDGRGHWSEHFSVGETGLGRGRGAPKAAGFLVHSSLCMAFFLAAWKQCTEREIGRGVDCAFIFSGPWFSPPPLGTYLHLPVPS